MFVECDSVCVCALRVLGVSVPACTFVCGLVGCVSACVSGYVCLCGEEPEVGICLCVDKVECLWDVGVWELTVGREELWVVLRGGE